MEQEPSRRNAAVDELPCGGDGEGVVLGCYEPDEGYIATLWPSVDHEIVHSVTRSVPFPSAFWEEGVAEALGRGRTCRSDRPLLSEDLHADDPFDVDYRVAGHFIRFLLENDEKQEVLQVSGGEAIEAAFGLPESELVSTFLQQAPYSYPAWEPCPFPEIAGSAASTS